MVKLVHRHCTASDTLWHIHSFYKTALNPSLPQILMKLSLWQSNSLLFFAPHEKLWGIAKSSWNRSYWKPDIYCITTMLSVVRLGQAFLLVFCISFIFVWFAPVRKLIFMRCCMNFLHCSLRQPACKERFCFLAEVIHGLRIIPKLGTILLILVTWSALRVLNSDFSWLGFKKGVTACFVNLEINWCQE